MYYRLLGIFHESNRYCLCEFLISTNLQELSLASSTAVNQNTFEVQTEMAPQGERTSRVQLQAAKCDTGIKGPWPALGKRSDWRDFITILVFTLREL